MPCHYERQSQAYGAENPPAHLTSCNPPRRCGLLCRALVNLRTVVFINIHAGVKAMTMRMNRTTLNHKQKEIESWSAS